MRRPASAALLAITLLGGMLSASTVAPMRDHEKKERGEDRSTGKDSRGDCEGSRQCSDDDFSPSFDKSPVYLCLPTATCNWGPGDGEQALDLPNLCGLPFHCDPKPQSMMPPDPVKMMGAIRTFTQGVGEAAGALAGAIAGGTIGILLTT